MRNIRQTQTFYKITDLILKEKKKSVKVVHEGQRLKNCSKLGKIKETWQLNAICMFQDKFLNQKIFLMKKYEQNLNKIEQSMLISQF